MLMKKREETHYVVLMSTGTYPDELSTALEARLRDTKKGFLDPCYHYFVEKDGNIETGRQLEHFAGGIKKHNKHSVIVKWAGGKDKRLKKLVNDINPLQKESISDILDELRDMFPESQVVYYEDLIKLK